MNKPCISVALLLLMSCSAPTQLQDWQRDTLITEIRQEVVYRDSIVFVPLPQGEASAILPDTDTSHLETIAAVSEAYVSRGELHHTLQNKALLLPVEIKMPKYIYTRNDHAVREQRVVEEIQVEKEFSRWQRFVMSIGYGVLLCLAVWLAVRLVRVFSL